MRAFVLRVPLRDAHRPAADRLQPFPAGMLRPKKRILPCSKSRWSYQGSSSSVTKSSIVPELSIDEEHVSNNRDFDEIHRAHSRHQAGAAYFLPLFAISSVTPALSLSSPTAHPVCCCCRDVAVMLQEEHFLSLRTGQPPLGVESAST